LIKARTCHRAVYAEKEKAIVVVGGSNTWPSSGFGECEMLRMESKDQKKFAWQSLPSLRHPRSCHGLCYLEGMVFACGGMMNPSRARGYGIEQFDLTNSCEYLDLNAEHPQWQEFPSLNFARFGLQLLPARLGTQNLLLAIGGRGPNPAAEYSVEAFVMGSEENKWVVLDAQLLSPRIDFAAVVALTHDEGVNVLSLGGNRVTEDDATDSSRNWEVFNLSVAEGKLQGSAVMGGRLPNSRVGCRASMLQELVPGKRHLVVAGGFRAWGEGQRTYGGPLDQSAAILEVGASGNGIWVDSTSAELSSELQKLPMKLHAPAVCTAKAYFDQEEQCAGA
jgi:hypothetical protein